MQSLRVPMGMGLVVGALWALAGCTAGDHLAEGSVRAATWPTLTPRPAATPVASPGRDGGREEPLTVTAEPRPSLTARSEDPNPWGIPAASEPPAHLEIPSVGIDTDVVVVHWGDDGAGEQGSWGDPGTHAGWLAQSALPGAGSNVVLVGHHNVRGEVFRDLVRVRVGDQVYLEADGRTYPYAIRERFIVPERLAPQEQREQNALWIAPTYDERLTLVTCWPYRDTTHRLIVVAKPGAPARAATSAPSD